MTSASHIRKFLNMQVKTQEFNIDMNCMVLGIMMYIRGHGTMVECWTWTEKTRVRFPTVSCVKSLGKILTRCVPLSTQQ